MRSTWQGWGSIEKVQDRPDGSIVVSGVASAAGVVDSQGETVTAKAMAQAIPDYMRWGAIREMHASSTAAGTALEMFVDGSGVTRLEALIVDSEAVKKVKAGVYKGFSIGGKVTARDTADPMKITGLSLVECSLVDRPANPAAVLTAWKAERAAEAVAEMAAARMVEMVGAQVAPAVPAPDPITPAMPEKKPQEEHHRGECPDCGARLVCVTCSGATARKADEVAKLYDALDVARGSVTRSLAKVAKAEAAPDDALGKVAAVKEWAAKVERVSALKVAEAQAERDAANEELRRRPKGALRAVPVAVEKSADIAGEAPEAEADDVRALIRKSHQRPSPLAADGGPFLRGRR